MSWGCFDRGGPLKRFFRLPVDDMLSAMEHLMTRGHPARSMAPMFATMLVTWFVYVPIHELLHAYGCIWTGGTVEELFIQGKYGGGLLKQWFPFVVTGGDYAGQLTKFTRDDDLIYFSTVFAPFLLTVFIGVPLVRVCTRRRHTWLFGSSVVLGLAPFYNVPGDYYEMASILFTRLLTFAAARFTGASRTRMASCSRRRTPSPTSSTPPIFSSPRGSRRRTACSPWVVAREGC